MRTGACYIRVSTDDQLEYSPDAQLRELKKYAGSRDIFIDERYIFIDEGITGKNTKKRDAFNRMIGHAKIHPRPFDVILLWKFSRFARNREDSIVYKSLLRKQCGIDVISITESVSDDNKMSILIEAMIEAMDEYYSINLAEEVKRGMTEKALRGEFQTAPPFGYSKIPGKELTIVDEEAKYVRYIFEQYLAGKSMFSIASNLNAAGLRTKRGNKFEHRQIEYMLNNPVYKGYTRWTPAGNTVGRRIYDCPDTLIVKSSHHLIIDEESWDMANARYKEEKSKRNFRQRASESKRHFLSGILKCSSCGASLAFSHANNGFQCINYAHGTCKPSHYISTTRIEPVIKEALHRLSLPNTYIKNIAPAQIPNEKKLLLQEMSDLHKMLERAKQAYLAGVDSIEEYDSNKKRFQNKIRRIESQMKTYERPIVPADQNALKTQIKDILELLETDISVAEKNAALSKTIEKIVFSRPNDEIDIFIYE